MAVVRLTAPWRGGMRECNCAECRQLQSGEARARGRRKAHQRLPADVRQQLVDEIDKARPFRTVLRDLGLTSNQVFGLAKTDEEWSRALETALTASRGGLPWLCLPRVR